MKSGKYTFKELFNSSNINQVLIPEIQRDYVWGSQQVTTFINSLKQGFQSFRNASFNLSADNEEVKVAFEEFYKRQIYSSNIGFIYAYNDPDYPGKYFLIDGQQRLTTLFLLLLATSVCSGNGTKEDFIKTYYPDNVLKIDYKVRESSHEFLKRFVKYILEDSEIQNIEKEFWFFDEYNSDLTITSIISNYKTILSENTPSAEFYDYLERFVEFWYFDTAISEQGEELYIYMNARGEQVQSYENIKAELLSHLNASDLEYVRGREEFNETMNIEGLKNFYGQKWEQWQDFFWRHRSRNSNADKGFNEFLNCIAGLENFKLGKGNVLSKSQFDSKGIETKTILKNNLTIPKIERYFQSLSFLISYKDTLGDTNPSYHGNWLSNCIDELLKLIIENQTNWFADPNDTNRGQEHSRKVFVWSILHFLHNEADLTGSHKLLRFLRLYFVRYKNYDRTIIRLFERAEAAKLDVWGDDENFTTEEKLKHWTYKRTSPETINQLEETIWEIEDHPYNLNGRDLSAQNISHLIDLESLVTLEVLNSVRDTFYMLFPLGRLEKNHNLLQSMLLFYGEYWERVSPWYYENYRCNNWGKIIRSCFFYSFFNEFKGTGLSLKVLYDYKKKQYLQESSDLLDRKGKLEQVIAYSVVADELGKNIWSEGGYIAFDVSRGLKSNRLLTEENIIFNTQGNFRGYSNIELWELVKESEPRELFQALRQSGREILVNFNSSDKISS